MGLLQSIKNFIRKITGKPATPTETPKKETITIPQPPTTTKATELTKKIKLEPTTTTPIRTISTTTMPPETRQLYKQLLQPKVNDNQLIEDIIHHREQILRHRMTSTITIEATTDKDTYTAQIKIIGALIEDDPQIQQQYEGKTGYLPTINLEAYNNLRSQGLPIRAALIQNSNIPPNTTIHIKIKNIQNDIQ